MNSHCDTHRQLPHISTQITLTFGGDQTANSNPSVIKATRRTADFFTIADAGGQKGGGRRSPILALVTGTPTCLEKEIFVRGGTHSQIINSIFQRSKVSLYLNFSSIHK